MNKVMSLHDAVAKFVENGDCICFGGFTTNRKPYAAVYEILRQGQGEFTVWAGPAGGDWDALIGAGRVKTYINCYTANSGYTNVSRRFRAAIEKGELIYEDYSQDVLMLQLHAASLGLPFLPVRLMQGSGLVQYWGISEKQRKTLSKVDNLKCVEMENPFEQSQKVVAVPVPKLDTAIIHVQQASPDGTCVILGDEFHDVDIAIAARKVIVTCEELVSDEYIRRDPTITKVFGQCVSAVVKLVKTKKAGKDLVPVIDKMNELIQDYNEKSKPAFCAKMGLVDEIVKMPMLRNYVLAFTAAAYQNPKAICPFHQMLLPRVIRDQQK